jgi:hypothetical protein
VTGRWGKLHNAELSDLYFLPSIIRIIMTRRMRWVGHLARVYVIGGKVTGKENAGKLSSGFTTGGLSSSAQLYRVSFSSVHFS